MKVLITKTARKDIEALPLLVQVRIENAILKLASYPEVAGIKALKGGLKGSLRIRVGAYRVLFEVAMDSVKVTAVDNRKDVY